ncbi:MAG: tRNA glutamyl-Q(34) synthetase GluQRS [Gammaproteobacteria bacterium]|nr:tRNA glutamyl-Q(34) synthetase GluQRS [Gammaproteobacteria bacterium]
MQHSEPLYRGRFAPSPTGPLHIGSLIAATASYLDAKSRHGQWLIRIEDIDPPREVAGAADNILRVLEQFGFEWDEDVVYQSRRGALYEEAISELTKKHLVYFCQCSRKDIAASATHGLNGPIYPGTCRDAIPTHQQGALRFETKDQSITFDDAICGKITQNVARDSGDFVIKRNDGLYAYQLAVVVDDAEQQITHVVRGRDILDLTPGQILLQQALKLDTVHYAHFPVITNALGQKLSKQTGAPPVGAKNPVSTLLDCLRFLGQAAPVELGDATLDEFWIWAISNWNLANTVTTCRDQPQ